MSTRDSGQLCLCPGVRNPAIRSMSRSCFPSGKKKEPKPKLLGPDIFGWGGGLPREGVGAEKFGMSLEARETKHFWRDIPGFCRDIPKVPEKFEKKKVRVQFPFPYPVIRSPQFGVTGKGSPRFVPICSDFPVFSRFVQICVSCLREFAPICSDFFRSVPICFQNKSEQIGENPFCRPLLQVPE